MKKSGLQFKNPRLVEMEMRINKGFEHTDNEPVDIKLSFNVNINRMSDSSEAIVELTVIVGTEDSTNPFYIKATEGAMFKWEDEITDIDKLLKQNAPAILLGYLRPVISMLTAMSPFAAYNIPAINFME